MDHTKLVIVQRYGTRPEVEVAKSELDSAGIRAMIQADTAGGMWEPLACAGAGFKILVREEDVTDGRDVLNSPAQGDEDSNAGSQTYPDARPPLRKFT